jgi:YD repeat-containing protein
LGRSYKTEVLNWDGTTPYTTTVQTFNGRDQVTKTRQYAGSVTSSLFQDVSMTYDGHGRMKTRHYPVEDVNTNTTWIYNNDDSVQQVIDPRNVITNFAYNSRGLVEQVSYSVPNNSTIPVAPTVNFTYDALGNRTQMTDGTGIQTYSYNQLSQIMSETKDFNDLANNLTISYTYNLGGSLKSITDPFSSTVNYINDKADKLNAVSGTAWGQNTTGNYANNIKYRAFGQIKQMDYTMPTETSQIKLEYDNRLRVNHSEVTSPNATGGFVMKADFNYFADSRVQAKDDLLDNKWDRTMKYDYAGRLRFNQFGMGLGSDNQNYKRVYEENISYDGFSQMTTRSGEHWNNDIGYAASYVNGRLQESGLTFDTAGNVVHQGDNYNPHNYQNTIFDAAGRRTVFFDSIKGRFGNVLNMILETKNEYVFDGDGRPVIEKRGTQAFHVNDPTPPPLTAVPQTYQVWSTVLGSRSGL